MKKHLKSLGLTIRRGPNPASNTFTRSEKVADMQIRGRFVSNSDLDIRLDNLRVYWWPYGLLASSFPSIGNDEVKVCQPFVTKVMNCFTGKRVRVERNKSIEIKNIPDPDAYKMKTVDKTSPDVVFYDRVNKVGSSAITMIGEVKAATDGEFQNHSIGQLTDGMERLMNKQPLRKYMYGFMTDGRRFLFIFCARDGEGFSFKHSSTFLNERGWQVKCRTQFKLPLSPRL